MSATYSDAHYQRHELWPGVYERREQGLVRAGIHQFGGMVLWKFEQDLGYGPTLCSELFLPDA